MKQKEFVPIFANIIEERAYVFVSKKVARLNGDIRVCFDMIKTAFNMLLLNLQSSDSLPDDSEIKVTLSIILKIYEQKYGSKIAENLKN